MISWKSQGQTIWVIDDGLSDDKVRSAWWFLTKICYCVGQRTNPSSPRTCVLLTKHKALRVILFWVDWRRPVGVFTRSEPNKGGIGDEWKEQGRAKETSLLGRTCFIKITLEASGWREQLVKTRLPEQTTRRNDKLNHLDSGGRSPWRWHGVQQHGRGMCTAKEYGNSEPLPSSRLNLLNLTSPSTY